GASPDGHRLIYEFLSGLNKNQPRIFICQCWQGYTNTPFYPIVQMLKYDLDLQHETHHKRKLEKLKFFAEQYELDANRIVPILMSLLENPYDDVIEQIDDDISIESPHYKLVENTANIEQIPDVLLEILYAASNKPVIFLLKDLQWADTSTKDLLTKLLEKVVETKGSQKILIIASHREQNPFSKTKTSDIEKTIQLTPLDKINSRKLAEIIVNKTNTPLNNSDIDSIVKKTGGIPHSIYAAIVNEDIPDSWFKKVMSYLENISKPNDEISPKRIAQIASFLENSFDYEQLRKTVLYCMKLSVKSTEYDAQLRSNFNTLTEKELIIPVPLAEKTSYKFVCENIREQIYNSISSQDRHDLHSKIAAMFIENNPNISEPSPELIARHYTQASKYALDYESKDKTSQQAAYWWHRTAKYAIHRLSLVVAINSLNKALLLLKEVTEGIDKLNLELQIYLDMATCHELLHGPSDEKVKTALKKAEEIAKKEGGKISIFRTQWRNWFYTYLRGNLVQAQNQAQELLYSPACSENKICLLEAHHAMWDTMFHSGKQHTIFPYHFRGLVLSGKLSTEEHGLGYAGHSAYVCCISRAALLMWFYGLADQSLALCAEAVDLAESFQHSNTVAHAHSHTALLYLFRNQPQNIEIHARKVIESATTDSIKSRLVFGQILLESAQLQKQPDGNTIKMFERHRLEWKSIGVRMFETLWLAVEAEAHLCLGNFTQGLNCINTAFDAIKETDENFYLAELLRINGELLNALNYKPQKIIDCFNRAMETAEKSHLKSLQLRAMVSLYKFLTNKKNSNKEITTLEKNLHEVYSSFTEGHNTTDLITAKKLLNIL
ncbi:MAG TPA: hypothetical protein DDX75_11545, partial [Phycisphaerales bacterium]|nr:hypothetical protein [Phycisphaerales bacterium]